MNTPRHLSAYEKNHLARFGAGSYTLAGMGTTPVEYLTGKAEFCGYIFSVTPQVLIPRVETEQLAEMALQHIRLSSVPNKPYNIAEIGTGSGAISVAVLKQLEHTHPWITWYASDISLPALEVAYHNACQILTHTHVIQPITWSSTVLQQTPPQLPEKSKPTLQYMQSDLMTSLPTSASYDLLIANLPYVPTNRIAILDASVKDHEPHLALDGGPDGFSLIAEFLSQAITRLKPNGCVLLEIDHTHTIKHFSQWITEWNVTLHTDCFGQLRFAKLCAHLQTSL